MLYALFQAQNDLFEPLRLFSSQMSFFGGFAPDMLKSSPALERRL
jgi:hypothetical protein